MNKEKSMSFNRNFDYGDFLKELDNQKPNIDLSVGAKLQYDDSWSNRYLSVSLTGTMVSADGANIPPKPAFTDPTHKGWYTQSVIVKIFLSDTSIFRKNDGPVTTGQSVTVTSGTSEQFGANAGAFGDSPVVGIQGGISTSESFSESIPDFSIINNSNAHLVSQLFHLTSSQNGSYSNPFSLEQQSGFHQPKFVPPPERALAGLAINSQVIWATPTRDYDKQVTLHISLEHTLANVSMNKYGFGDLSAHMHAHTRRFDWNAEYQIDFSQVSLIEAVM